tara:strand:+ start:3776 stop:4330 length:555 start_codon:yes stop_codon:yes gene_type:complete
VIGRGQIELQYRAIKDAAAVREWFRRAKAAGWLVQAINGRRVTMQCACIGCRNRLTLRFADLSTDLGRCDWPHVLGYSREAFDQYAALVDVLRRRRMALGLDQMDLGAVMGMADGYVNKLESFARIASPSTLLLWLQAVGLELTGCPAALPPLPLNAVANRQNRQIAKVTPSQAHRGSAQRRTR